MKPVSLAILLSVVAFAATAEAQRHRPPTPTGTTGRVMIISQNQGASVYVDERLVGTVPVDPQVLPAGQHTLRVTLEGFTDFTDVVTVRAGQDVQAEVELFAVTSILQVTTIPDHAQVFVDDRFAGDTPLHTDLLEGVHHVKVRLLGFHDVLRDVTGVAGSRVELSLTLEALPPEEDPTRAHQHWYDNPWTWIAIGGGALGLAAVIVLIAVLTSSQPSVAENYCRMDPAHCIQIDAGF